MRKVLAFVLLLVLPVWGSRQWIAGTSSSVASTAFTVALSGTVLTVSFSIFCPSSDTNGVCIVTTPCDAGILGLSPANTGGMLVQVHCSTSASACGTTTMAWGVKGANGQFFVGHIPFPSLGAWHTVVLTMKSNSSSGWTAYVDGVSQTVGRCDQAPTNTTIQANPQLFLGGDGLGGSCCINGNLAQVTFWLATLTASEAASLGTCIESFAVHTDQAVVWAPLYGADALERVYYQGHGVTMNMGPPVVSAANNPPLCPGVDPR